MVRTSDSETEEICASERFVNVRCRALSVTPPGGGWLRYGLSLMQPLLSSPTITYQSPPLLLSTSSRLTARIERLWVPYWCEETDEHALNMQ